jgi:MinD-like ATPase involved in chromosome partitioning or flagellar assembly
MMEHNKKPGRTLQDYAHLFLSRNQDREKTATAPQNASGADIESPAKETPPAGQQAGDETAAASRGSCSARSSSPEERAAQPPGPAVEQCPKFPYAIALCCPDRPLANSFLTFNLCLDCFQRDLQMLVINADLSFPSMNFLAELKPHAMKSIASQPESSRARNPHTLQVFTLDMDITVLNSPWPDEQNPVVEEISEAGRNADIILINTAVGFSANAKALFKAADETIIISGTEPAQLINAYSTVKMIYQIAAPQPRISVIMTGPEDAALRGFKKLQEAAQQFLGRSLNSYGYFPWDADVINSIMRKTALPSDGTAAQRLQEISELVFTKNTRQQHAHASHEPGFLEKLFITSGQKMGVTCDAIRQQRWSR